MSFNTLEFFLFLPIVFILYYALPHKFRTSLLLIASILFYVAYAPTLVFFLAAVTVLSYIIALKIYVLKNPKTKKVWTVLGIVLSLGTLGFYKYFNFLSDIINELLRAVGLEISLSRVSFVVPLGISFIIFQVVSYIIDVSRGSVQPERNFLKYAVYVAFFPKVVQGPITRAEDFLPQLDEIHVFDKRRFSEGFIMLLYGLFMKMVVADNAAIIVNTVFSDVSAHSGAAVLFATLVFAMQIYYDFAGYSYTAIGASKLFGFELKQNFRQPYMSKSVSEFWRRWHISLNVWLREYLYIPLGGGRVSPRRKRFNTLVTFTLSGLWHGANWGYIIWGFLNGVFINTENRIKAWFRSWRKKNTAKSSSPVFVKVKDELNHMITFCLISFAWLFFRAADYKTSFLALKQIFGAFELSAFLSYCKDSFSGGAGSLFYGLDVIYRVPVLVVAVIVVAIIDIISDQKPLASDLAGSSRALRWTLYLIMLFAIILFGVYGYGYDAASFIYANF